MGGKCCTNTNTTSLSNYGDVKRGRVAIVTGPTSGIGLVTARELAKHGFHVVLAGRDASRLQKARHTIQQSYPAAVLTELVLDLSSLKSVRSFAAEFHKLNLPLHLLVNNAGIMGTPYSTTVDGFETQFATNHLGPFLLTSLLLPLMVKTSQEPTTSAQEPKPSVRIVNVGSSMQTMATVSEKNDQFNLSEAQYSRTGAYANSKLANTLHAYQLSRRLVGTNVQAFSLHPGVFTSGIGRNWCLIGCMHAVCGCCLPNSEQSAATTIHCALAPNLVSGDYFQDCKSVPPPNPLARSNILAIALWEASEKMTESGPILPPQLQRPPPIVIPQPTVTHPITVIPHS